MLSCDCPCRQLMIGESLALSCSADQSTLSPLPKKVASGAWGEALGYPPKHVPRKCCQWHSLSQSIIKVPLPETSGCLPRSPGSSHRNAMQADTYVHLHKSIPLCNIHAIFSTRKETGIHTYTHTQAEGYYSARFPLHYTYTCTCTYVCMYVCILHIYTRMLHHTIFNIKSNSVHLLLLVLVTANYSLLATLNQSLNILISPQSTPTPRRE